MSLPGLGRPGHLTERFCSTDYESPGSAWMARCLHRRGRARATPRLTSRGRTTLPEQS